MLTKRQLLQDLKGEKVTIYTVEKEFTGTLRENDNEFSICHVSSHSTSIIRIMPSDIVDVKKLSAMPVIFMLNHFNL